MLAMVKGVEMLPQTTVTAAARKKIYNQAYVAYFRDTGLDMNTKEVPTMQNLVWVNEEINRQEDKQRQVRALVACTSKRGH